MDKNEQLELLEVVNDVDAINPEALDELSNGKGEDD